MPVNAQRFLIVAPPAAKPLAVPIPGPAAAERAGVEQQEEGSEMHLNLKALGLALVAVFAMSAIAASAAQATPTLTSEVSPVTLEATAGGLGSGEKFVAFNESVECEKSTFHTPLTKTPATEFTVEAEYGPECRTGTGLRATVTMNGCDYVFHNLKFIKATPDYEATVDIKCPAGKVIEVHIYATKAAHEAKNSLCTLTIPEQANLEKATITNKTTSGKNFGDLIIEGTIGNIHAIQHRNSILCPAGTETNTAEEIIPSGEKAITVNGTKEGGGGNDIELSGE
jgi:hypothetical protein